MSSSEDIKHITLTNIHAAKWRHETTTAQDDGAATCRQVTNTQHDIAQGSSQPTLLSSRQEGETSWCNLEANSPHQLTSHRTSSSEQHLTSNYVMWNGSQNQWHMLLHTHSRRITYDRCNDPLTSDGTTWRLEWNMQASQTDKAKTWKKSQQRVVKVPHEGNTQ